MPVFLTVEQVAERLSVPVPTVQYWIQCRKFRTFKPGRRRLVREDDLAAFLDSTASSVPAARPARKAGAK